MLHEKNKSGHSASAINTIIGSGARIEGELIVSELTRVDGMLHGKLTSESGVIVGEHGVVEGDIKAGDVLVAGTVHGNIRAAERIEITATGHVQGDLFTDKLVIDEGASFQGNCDTGVSPTAAKALPEPEMEPYE